MSWEDMSSEKYSCPCGKSTFTVTTHMDDWNRTDSSMRMDCDVCRSKYVLYHEDNCRSGMVNRAQFWISKQTQAKCQRLKDDAKSLRKRASKLKSERILPKWKAHFEGKNKKQTWKILTDNGARYPALGTFYQHTKYEGMDAYLMRHFKDAKDQDFMAILAVLGIDDPEIISLIHQTQDLEKAARDLVWRKKFPK